MEIILGTLAVMAVAFGLSFLIIKYGPKEPVCQPCQHENVEQSWFIQHVLQRKCLDCGKKEEWDTNKRFNKLWNPKFINGKPIGGIELEKMLYHKADLEKKNKPI